MPDVFRQGIPEHPVAGKPLGRHILHDERSRDFTAEQAPAIVSVKHAAHGLPLTQARGSCTAEALIGACDSAPDWKGLTLGQTVADSLYDDEIRAQGMDPATDDPGGTGLLVCKCAQARGLIGSYQHAFGLAQALAALVLRPVITGVNWYDSFDQPNRRGHVTISPGAQVRGGHEFVVDQIVARSKCVWAWNSWGPDWGHHGRFCLSFATWERLLAEAGDVTVPVV